MGGVWLNCQFVETKVKKIAAHLLEANESDAFCEGVEVKIKGTRKSLGWHEFGLAADTAHIPPDDMVPGLKEGAFYDPVNLPFRRVAISPRSRLIPKPVLWRSSSSPLRMISAR